VVRRREDGPLVGCSGWNYKSWRGTFYPRSAPVSSWLSYYAERFNTVEANGTFYRLPEATTFAAWRRHTPSRFVMAVKASRLLTHMKRLRDPNEPLRRLFTRARALGDRLGPVLYQLPGNMTRDLDRLQTFLRALPRTVNGRRPDHVMEFRHTSWYVRDVFELLEDHDVALCLHDKLGSPIAEPFIGRFVYVRFHGPTGQYAGSYSRAHLEAWARRLTGQWKAGRRVFAYFNNDVDGAAVANATVLDAAIRRVLERSGDA
jgi:uncharacterized protein YecE (DUF72 family)